MSCLLVEGPGSGCTPRRPTTARVAFRYRYYTSAETIDADLQAWLRFDNFERSHPGYRTQDRTSASIFFGGQRRSSS